MTGLLLTVLAVTDPTAGWSFSASPATPCSFLPDLPRDPGCLEFDLARLQKTEPSIWYYASNEDGSVLIYSTHTEMKALTMSSEELDAFVRGVNQELHLQPVLAKNGRLFELTAFNGQTVARFDLAPAQAPDGKFAAGLRLRGYLLPTKTTLTSIIELSSTDDGSAVDAVLATLEGFEGRTSDTSLFGRERAFQRGNALGRVIGAACCVGFFPGVTLVIFFVMRSRKKPKPSA